MSSCLSKSLLGRILFDCFRIPNVLHLGMEKKIKEQKLHMLGLLMKILKFSIQVGLHKNGVKIISF